MPSLILASQSPRRKQLLEQMDFSFTVKTSSIVETMNDDSSPADVVQKLAREKAKAVWNAHRDAVVLAADTVVVYDGKILGKPRDEREAIEMLRLLSGRIHHVYTGVALCSTDGDESFAEQTAVEFYPLTEEDIFMYVKSGEPLDKAGAYGIQGLGALFVKRIEGDYFNVVGLPIAKTTRALIKKGIYPGFYKKAKGESS